MIIGSVIVGSGLAGLIVRTPEPGMLKATVSNPELALASRIAWRSEPAPVSLVLVTVKVDDGAMGSNWSRRDRMTENHRPTRLTPPEPPELPLDGPAKDLDGSSASTSRARSILPRSTQATHLSWLWPLEL